MSVGSDTVKLVSTALDGGDGFTPLSEQEKLYSFAAAHKIPNLVCLGLRKCGIKPIEKFEQASLTGLYGCAVQEAALDEIGRAFTSRGIHYLPLKGSELRKLYPSDDLRTCGDLDILIEDGADRFLPEIASETGLEFKDDSGVEVTYVKKPFLCVEFHRSLMENHKKLDVVLCDIWQRLVPSEGTRLKMTDEDFYIYMIIHTAKHFSMGGCGIRFFADVYLYLKSHTDMDNEYISKTLSKAGLSVFERSVKALSDYWFAGGDASLVPAGLETFVFSSGAYGSASNAYAIDRTRVKQTRLRNKLFPSLKIMKGLFPVLEKAPVLLPVMWVWRLVKALFTRTDAVTGELNAFRASNGNASRGTGELLRLIGLSEITETEV